MSGPTDPGEWHAKTFRDADFWRHQSEAWEALANAAVLDGDIDHAAYARRNAAGCRHNARLKELSL